jgi:hypothetical protein
MFISPTVRVVEHFEGLACNIFLGIGEKTSVDILLRGNVSFPKTEVSVVLSPRDLDDIGCVSTFIPGRDT